MKLDNDHLYHGGALIQIAEHEKFTAINSLRIGTNKYTNSYRINDNVVVYLKYSSKPRGPFSEYVFTFGEEHMDELEEVSSHCSKMFLAMVCVKAREVCCIPYKNLVDLIDLRKKSSGTHEEQYSILITAPAKKHMQVYVNAPGKKGIMLGKPLRVPRNGFPDIIFS